jgi:hypothetical protein
MRNRIVSSRWRGAATASWPVGSNGHELGEGLPVPSVVRPRPYGLRLIRMWHELSEGLPVPREPAYAAKRSQDGEAQAASNGRKLRR